MNREYLASESVQYVREASELGLAPGFWPNQLIAEVAGERMQFFLDDPYGPNDEATYVARDGTTLVVLND